MDQDYMPFGGDLPEIDQTEVLDKEANGYKYTGQKQVASIGLYYYGARYYDPSIGRFITEDSYPGEITNPQTQNLYIYVVNNPLRYIDPTGHKYVEHDGGGYPWTPPETDPGKKLIDSGGSGSKPSLNLNVKPGLNPQLDLNGDYSFENDWDMVTGVDARITVEQLVINTDIPRVTLHQNIFTINLPNGYVEMTTDLYTNKIGNTIELNTVYNFKQSLVEKNTMAMQWYHVYGKRIEEIKYEKESQNNLIAVEGFVTGATYYRALMIGVNQQGIVSAWQGSTLPNNSTDYGTIAETRYGEPYRMTRGLHSWEYAAIWLENNNAIPTINANPNQDGKYIADYIHIHSGYREWNRGSAGCPTIRPCGNKYPDGQNWLNFQKAMVYPYQNGEYIGDFYLNRY